MSETQHSESGGPLLHGPPATAGEWLRTVLDAFPHICRRHVRTYLAHLMDVPPTTLIAEPGKAPAPNLWPQFVRGVRAMAGGAPLSRLVGERAFWTGTFALNHATLDPRPESEGIVETAIDHSNRDAPLRVLDLGTGTGCLLISILMERPHAYGVGVDIAPAALDMAQYNARRNGVAERATWLQGSWFAPVEGAFDMIVANPPYIATTAETTLSRTVREHDPPRALFAGADGLDAYQCIADSAAAHTTPATRLIVEIGAGQADAVSAIFSTHGFTERERRQDLAGHVRILVFAPA